MESLVFLSGKRNPFGANGGSFRDVPTTDLALSSANAAIAQAGVRPDQIDHTIYGSVLYSTAESIYIPRHVGLKAGIPQDRPALGLNRLCGSGFQVIVDAYMQMLAGDSQCVLVGGVENMSQVPYVLRSARWGSKMGNQVVADMMMESLTDAYSQTPMAITAENLAEIYKITREQSDAFSLRSQKRYADGLARGIFKDEIAPFTMKDKKGNEVSYDKDEHPKPETTPEVLAKLKPVFKKDGIVTAASASGIVDGAASMVVSTEKFAQSAGLKPLGRLISYGISGCEPKIMGIGPVPSSKIALKKAGMTLGQMDLVEVNEAFAAQALSVQKELQIPDEIFNVNGGAIAVGHPLAASGTRITQHILYELRRRKKRFGLAAACIGGGQGIALVVEAFPS
jgi:acetyl-CoA C-acetyltransferase/acetyl-CoA acyltransferase 2